MRYRWKVFFLLITISLVPIIVMRLGFVRNVRAVARSIGLQTHQNLIADAQTNLRRLVESYTAVIGAERSRVEMALALQAKEVEQALAESVPATFPVHFLEEYDTPGTAGLQTVLSPWHIRYRPKEGKQLMDVSYSNMVFTNPPGTDRSRMMSDAARLATLAPFFETVHQSLLDSVLWHYVSLKNGLHCVYPGHGGIPCDLDARQQPWYWEKPDETAPPWTNTYIDPETRQFVMAASRQVHRPDGSFAGMTSLVVPLTTILDRKSLISHLPPETKSFMTLLVKEPETGELGLKVSASHEFVDVKHRGWRTSMSANWLTSIDKQEYQGMLQDMQGGFANTRRMSYEKEDSLWVYGPALYESADFAAFLVLITPYAEIVRPAVESETRLNELMNQLFYLTGFAVLAMLVIVTILAFTFSRRVTRPIQQLVEGSNRLAAGDFDTLIHIKSHDELGDLGRAFNSLGPRLKDHYRMSQSLALAMEVQQNLIPLKDPQIPGLDVAGRIIYCDETGGDFYDYLDLSGDYRRFGVVVADVSDHGIQAALLMASARAFLRQRASLPGGVAEVFTDVNYQVARDIEETGRFLSAFGCEFNLDARTVTWVRAGHDPALLYDPGTDSFTELGGPGVALGITQNYKYNDFSLELAEGQVILIATDGMWETRNPKGEMFGKDELRRIMRDNAGRNAHDMVETLVGLVDEFRGGHQPSDDVTLVILKVL